MKFHLSKKQKSILIIVLAFAALILVTMILVFSKHKNNDNQLNEPGSTVLKTVFLNNKEKTELNIQPETKIQVIKKDADGKIVLYKVIRNDSDIITDLNQIKAVSPSAEK